MSADSHKIFESIQTCKESLANLVQYKVTAELDETLKNAWTKFVSDITIFNGDFILFTRSLTSRKPVDDLQKRLGAIQNKFSEVFGEISEHARFVVLELRRCVESLKSLYYQLPIETPSVKSQYELLRWLEYEEQQDQRKQMEGRQSVLSTKIEKIIAENASDNLKRQLVNLNAAIIREMNHIYFMSTMKADTHYMKEESLAVTIETLNLEISRLKSKLTEKKGHSWNPFARRPANNDESMEVDALLTTLKTYV